ncbi:extracellular solute-binding protein [Paenibacillus allorhizosphaerae]|uniref:Extracellular solute-binding protein n=1 Tax=Paenibacillus allorhizosphaerae TaxID=2849866 RepID=A0ABN7TAQ2_9BACL|nr:extracellular solute-binding protein [Paenibacillus allorhizosphaerae]CAG7616804.1 hypothetical protein PAECIP111802_00330 [Paenibacillus allorhizosphaerae]
MVNKFNSLVMLTTIVTLVLSGCQAAKPGVEQDSPVSSNPVTLKIFVHAVRLTDTEYQKFILEPLKKTHPNITMERLEGKLEDLIVAGNIPDLILTDNDWYSALTTLDLQQDLTDLIKEFRLDVNTFVPESIQAVKQLSDSGKMYAIPFSLNVGALFYNKDLFDRFGIPYPKDDMTWKEVLDLSKKLTRNVDGVQYIGWEPGFPDAIASPYSQPFVDPKTNKAVVDTDVYRKVFELMKQVYEQPGFIGANNKFTYAPKEFIVDKKVGMMTEWSIKMIGDLVEAIEQGASFNWDMVTIPNFEDKAGKGRHMLASMMIITKNSPYKKQAMHVIQTVTSPEAQRIQARNARVPVLNDEAIKKEYGKDIPWMAAKNVASLFKFKASPTPKPNLYDKEVQPFIRQTRKAIAIDNKDINTALREAQEAADKRLQELRAK